MQTSVNGWGQAATATMEVVSPRNVSGLSSLTLRSGEATAPRAMIPRGLGRSYGDAAQLDGGTAVSLDRFQTMQWIDAGNGLLRVGAGVSIASLIDRFVPQGWFVPVTPGTRNVTVGGAIAADIHGKNHHRDGSWCEHVDEMVLMVASGDIVTASRSENPGLFQATSGGMGLTGVIIEATIRMSAIGSSTLLVETRRTQTLDELMDTMLASDDDHRFSVAWVDIMNRDCRGVLTLGDFAEAGTHPAPGNLQARLPRVPTPNLIQRPFVKAFNEAWFRRAPAQPKVTCESITAFFHPLDMIANWNRIYGSAGFLQWQIALPDGTQDVLRSVTRQLHASGVPSFLSVLKRFGPANPAPLSFPMAGWTLTVDVPAGSAETNAMLDRLDLEVVDAGGRIYLAKDLRMQPELLGRMYPRLDEWRRTREAWDPNRRFDSDLARRLAL